MSSGEAAVKLIVEFAVIRKPEPDEIFRSADIKVIEAVPGTLRVHDTNTNFASAPCVEGLTGAEDRDPVFVATELVREAFEDPFDVVDISVPYDDRPREAFEEFPERVELRTVKLVPRSFGVIDSSVGHLQ